MAKARQCDRCGKFYAYNCNTPETINVKTYSGFSRSIYLDDPAYHIDLCEGCLKEFNGWWVKIAHLSPANRSKEAEKNEKR